MDARDDLANRKSRKLSLVSDLLEFACTAQSGAAYHVSRLKGSVDISYDKFGKPELYVDGKPGPSVSFSHAGGSMWATLCLTCKSVGIDAAVGTEFPDDYPFHRAFHQEELCLAQELKNGNLAESAAFLWTGKEAVVKCIGSGFNFIDPLDVRIIAGERSLDGYDFAARFTDRVLQRLPELQELSVPVLTFREAGVWVSMALIAKDGT